MKKIAMLLLAMILVVSMAVGSCTVSAQQYTKDDLLKLASTSPIYKHLEGEIKNLLRTIDATDEQLNQLYALGERFSASDLKDKGDNAHFYNSKDIALVMSFIDEACEILDLHYTFTPSKDPKHIGDDVFTLYDANNKVIYVRDSDIIKKTGPDTTVLFVSVAAAGCLLLAGAVVLKKRKTNV